MGVAGRLSVWETKTLENARQRRLRNPSRRSSLGADVRTTARFLVDRRRAEPTYEDGLIAGVVGHPLQQFDRYLMHRHCSGEHQFNKGKPRPRMVQLPFSASL